ncbi:MAG: alkaline phosphatase [Planctomycetota bacterium]
MHHNPTRIALAASLTACSAASLASAQEAKNIILMISDGAGDTTWKAANQWQFGADANTGPAFQQRWENDFTQHWMTTFPGNTQPIPPALTGGSVLPISLINEFDFPAPGSYDPAAANDQNTGPVNTLGTPAELGRGTTVPLTINPVLEFIDPGLVPLAELAVSGLDVTQIDPGFAGYDYLTTTSITDSAAAGTALATGVKSYNSAISVDLDMQPLELITQRAKAQGKAAGIVTTKEFTDATPAAFSTNNISRDNEAEISHDMIHNGLLDVIISPGHPEFDAASPAGPTPDPTPDYNVVSEANLQALRDGTDGWTLVDDANALADIANGTQPAPDRLFGLVPVSSALHSRTGNRTNAYDPTVFDPADPNGAVPFVMPDLDALTQAAINTLAQDDDGFFLMVEGASVDSAAHANDLPRMIEEQLSFNRAIDQVIDWIENPANGSSWDDTLLIITTDHANGMFLGPDSATTFMQDPVPTAPGELPDGIWWSTEHTNELVPLWTFGPGSELFATLTDGFDPRRGDYIDNTDVYTVMSQVVPEPSTAALLAAGMAVMGFRRRG